MNKLLLATAALSLVLAGPALAQDEHHDHNTSAGHVEHVTKGGGQVNQGHGTPGGHYVTPNPTVTSHQTVTQPVMHPQMGHVGAVQYMGGQPAHHADYGRFHRNFQAARHFHVPIYHRPQGWYAHRWVYGERLPVAFYARDYWIGDWGAYGLMPPPDGCVWVRVGDDALLIDEYDGEVIQVVYGLFD